jgi:iron complex transport system substrate-binding protein
MEGYKPLTPEAVVEADPQAILMFDMGVESLEGMQGVKSIPAIASTQAAKNDEFIIMDGHLLAGFGPRVGKALLQLNQEFTGINE